MSNTEAKSLEFSPKDFQIYFGEKNYIHLTLGPTETIDNFAKAHFTDVNLIIDYERCQTTYSGCSLVGLKNLERKLIFAYDGKVEKFEMKTGNIFIATGKSNPTIQGMATGAFVQDGDIKFVFNEVPEHLQGKTVTYDK